MAILTPDALPSNIRFDTDTGEIYEVDGSGNEVAGTRSAVATDVALLITNRNSWQSAETSKVASQVANATPTTSGKSYMTLGGIGVLKQKVYDAVLPINENTSIVSMSIACATSGSANITFQLKKIPNGSNTAQNLGSGQTLTAGNTYQSFSFSPELGLVPGDRVQVEVTTSLTGVTAPTKVTISLVTKVG